MTLQIMLYLYPSFAKVSVKPTCDNFAAMEVHQPGSRVITSSHFTGIIALAEIAKQPGRRSSINDPAILLLAKVWPRSMRALSMS